METGFFDCIDMGKDVFLFLRAFLPTISAPSPPLLLLYGRCRFLGDFGSLGG